MATRTTTRRHSWARKAKDALLDMRICDLGLRLSDSPITKRIDKVHAELDARGIVCKPHFWLSDEWFCPDGIPGVAVPFYLAHPRLRQLEMDFMMEVEGGDPRWCMKLVRHETAHAILNAYKLDQRRDWRRVFGRPNAKYPDTYLPKPYSKRFVVHLPNWYAQSHPHEDWAETFAVWLDPRSDWRKRYRNWPALKKLEYVETLMSELRDRAPRLRNRQTYHPVEKIRTTLRRYYEDKLARYGSDSPEFFDRDLRKLFVEAGQAPRAMRASRYIRRHKKQVIDIVERWTDEYKYRINEVMKDMIKRCDELDLRILRSNEDMLPEMTACLTMLVMNKLHSGGFHYSL